MVVTPAALDVDGGVRPNAGADRFDTWAIVELLGHRRLVARVTEATLAGHGFLRLDEPAVDGQPERTSYASPASVYAIHPCTQEAAMAVAAEWRTAPISRYDLPDDWRKAIDAADGRNVVDQSPDDPWGVGPPD